MACFSMLLFSSVAGVWYSVKMVKYVWHSTPHLPFISPLVLTPPPVKKLVPPLTLYPHSPPFSRYIMPKKRYHFAYEALFGPDHHENADPPASPAHAPSSLQTRPPWASKKNKRRKNGAQPSAR